MTPVEHVEVWRGVETTDVDGNVVQGALALWKTFPAYIAPLTEAEVQKDSSRTLTIGYTLYVRGQPTGIIESDVILVRGEKLPVTGRVTLWISPSGEYKGDVITVSWKRG